MAYRRYHYIQYFVEDRKTWTGLYVSCYSSVMDPDPH
jgi:hypothetical protein